MWIVRLALRRPYTFVVASILAFILGILTIFTMPTDIFPEINIPVIAVSFQYAGMPPEQMEGRITSQFERAVTTTVNDIEHIESQSLVGIAVIKIYFYPDASIGTANAQVTAISQTILRAMPQGIQPPLIIQYNASNVPILQLGLSSASIPEQKLFDYGNQIIRSGLAVVQGAQLPYPYGGKIRQVVVDLDPERMYAWGISATDVNTALGNQNLIVPAGTTKIGTQEMPVMLNSSPETVNALNDLPIKTVNGVPVYIKDVANVRDGFQVQTSIVHTNGKRGVLMVILKAGKASTVSVVNRVFAALPGIQAQVPPEMKITPLFDQSIFVKASAYGVVREGIIAACLTALMILIFLGSWRSTLIVVMSIPLSILVSIILMGALGETLNVMTLGGLALAVGILVDDATVEIENTHRNLSQGKRLVQGILDGAQQIAVPAFVSTLCICIVFVPVVFISGSARSLFTPLALAVVFAMLTSYLLSRTLVPTMMHYLLASEVELYGGHIDPADPHADAKRAHEFDPHARHPYYPLGDAARWGAMWVGIVAAGLILLLIVIHFLSPPIKGGIGEVPGVGGMLAAPLAHWLAWIMTLVLALLAVIALRYLMMNNWVWRAHEAFNRQFEKLRRGYGAMLALALEWRGVSIVLFGLLVVVSCSLFLGIGEDFFPTVDAGQIRLHVRNPPGTRIEETERVFGRVEDFIRTEIPPEQIGVIMDNMGIPNSSINLSLSDGSLMSPADGEINIALKPDHDPTEGFMTKLALDLPKHFPNQIFFFAPADIVTQVLNFGISAPIDIRIAGTLPNQAKDYEIAKEIQAKLREVPGAADIRIQQVPNTPNLHVDVNRSFADEIGVSESAVANNMLISLSGTAQIAPTFWLDPHFGVQYNIITQTPQYAVSSMNELGNTPVRPDSTPAAIIAGTSSAAANRGSIPLVSPTQLLSNVSEITPHASPSNITHYQVLGTFDVLAGARGTDLGSVARAVDKIVAQEQPNRPRATTISVVGQVQSMRQSFSGLGYGLLFAVVLVYLLMVVNFQSWLDPLIILMALPGALSGILWMLFATGTTISVPALMGAIMSIGVATSNSILMITFANDQRKEGLNAHDAALSAGLTRLRPVLMTALAMIIGMLPMSLGLGEGGEQNAPLGRAVIGGLLMATFATLFFVPICYSIMREKAAVTQVEPELQE